MSELHERILNSDVQSDCVTTVSECESLMIAAEMTEEELLAKGYSAEAVADIKDGTVEQQLRKAIFERAQLSNAELLGMGYTETEITALKNLTGNETLAELDALGVSANCTTYNSIISHFYRSSNNKTYLICAFGWEWDKAPAYTRIDCAG